VGIPTRADYSLAEGLTYFNHGSIGTVPRVVQRAHAEYISTCESNPWLYMWGGAWEEARESTRQAAATYVGCEAAEIAINRNTTDGFNLLAAGLPLQRGDEVVFSNLNHPGASVCWEHCATARGFTVRKMEIPFADVPEMTEAALVERHRAAVTKRTRVLIVPHLDNTLGILTPVRAIAKAVRAVGVEFVFVDGAQTIGMLPVDIAALGVDAYCMSPHKWLQAPKGLGLLYLRKDLQKRLRPHTVTWGQRSWRGTVRMFEDYGTRDLSAVLALGDAIIFQAAAGIANTAAMRKKLWDRIRAKVQADDRLIWRSPNSWELNGSLCAIEVRGKQSAMLGARLWKEHKIVVRAFPAKGLNILRLSLNTMNTAAEIDAFFVAVNGLR